MEVMHAIIQYKDKVPSSNIIHAFAYFRDQSFISQVEDNMKWIFEFEYKLPNESIPSNLKFQYTSTPNAAQYKSDLDELNELIRSSPQIVKVSDYICSGATTKNHRKSPKW